MLLMGWEGTLAPAVPQGASLPDDVERRIGAMLRDALASVRGAGGGLPVEQLLRPLRQRLLAVEWVSDGGFGGERSGAEWAEVKRGMVEEWRLWVELFLARLEGDGERLARWMGLEELPRVVALEAAASEVRGGVVRVGFAGGRGIFYKARPVSGELLWAELNGVIARADEGAVVVTAGVLEGGAGIESGAGVESGEVAAYGWMEELVWGECEEGTHWRKAGVLLCLAAHVGLGDLQMSNVVVTSAGPAVVDAECLGVCERGEGGLGRMLLRTGLLPDAGVMPDVSGLFGGTAPVGGLMVPVWRDGAAGTSAVRLLEQRNRPRMRRLPLACLPEMLEGYVRAARALDTVRSELLARDGWVERVGAMHSPRLVLRSTLEYGLLLSESLLSMGRHGMGERGEGLREALCERGEHAEVLETEIGALLRLQVPRFHVARGSRDLVAGNVVVSEDAVPMTVEGGVRGRLEAISLDASEVRDALAGILFQAPRTSGRPL